MEGVCSLTPTPLPRSLELLRSAVYVGGGSTDPLHRSSSRHVLLLAAAFLHFVAVYCRVSAAAVAAGFIRRSSSFKFSPEEHKLCF